MEKSNVGEFEEWLKRNGLKDTTVAKLIEEDITDKSLLCKLDKEDIKGFEFTVGQRKTLEGIIASIQADQQDVPQEERVSTADQATGGSEFQTECDNREKSKTTISLDVTGVSGGKVEHSNVVGIMHNYFAFPRSTAYSIADKIQKHDFEKLWEMTEKAKETFMLSFGVLRREVAYELFVTTMYETYKAVHAGLSPGCVVLTFLHETKEDAQYMMDDRENVLKLIREFLKELDPSIVYDIIVSKFEDLSQKDLQHFKLLKVSLLYIKQNLDRKDTLIQTMGSYTRQHILNHLSCEIDTLKLYDIKIRSYKMVQVTHATLKDPQEKRYSQRDGSDGVQETGVPGYTEIEDLQKRLRERKQLFPLLKNVVTRDKEMIFYLQSKKSFLTKANQLEGKGEILGLWKPKETGLKTDAAAGLVDEEQNTIGATETQLLKSKDLGETGEKWTAIPMLERDFTSKLVLQEKDWENIAELRDKLQQMKNRTVNQGKELLNTCKEDRQEWEYKLDYLSKEIPVLAIYPCITDVFGEDIIPVSVDQSDTKDVTGIAGIGKLSPVHKLRQFQHGRLTNRKLIDILRKVIIKDNSALSDLHAEIAYLEQVYGCPVHMVGEVDSPRSGPVSCPPMTFNRERVYKRLTVSQDGLQLVISERGGNQHDDRLRNYWGTCSRLPIPLPVSPSTLTVPRYWETHSRVQVRGLYGPLLEMGVCGEGEVDTKICVSYQTRSSWSVCVNPCDEHDGYCTQVWENGRQVGGCHDTVSRTPGTDLIYKWGIALDMGRGRLAFLDVKRGLVLHLLDIEVDESLVPMFSVQPLYDHNKISLVSGSQLPITDTHKHLIAKALYGPLDVPNMFEKYS